ERPTLISVDSPSDAPSAPLSSESEPGLSKEHAARTIIKTIDKKLSNPFLIRKPPIFYKNFRLIYHCKINSCTLRQISLHSLKRCTLHLSSSLHYTIFHS